MKNFTDWLKESTSALASAEATLPSKVGLKFIDADTGMLSAEDVAEGRAQAQMLQALLSDAPVPGMHRLEESPSAIAEQIEKNETMIAALRGERAARLREDAEREARLSLSERERLARQRAYSDAMAKQQEATIASIMSSFKVLLEQKENKK